MTYVTINAIKELAEKQAQVVQRVQSISDFATATISGNSVWIEYSAEFKEQLAGNLPVLNITSYDPGQSLAIGSKSTEGFEIVRTNGQTDLQFDWVAFAKVALPNVVNGSSQDRQAMLQKTTALPSLIVAE